jgi:hypothetical protein
MICPRAILAGGVAVLITALAGCTSPQNFSGGAARPLSLGAISDQVWMTQEDNAEASKFVVYEHEFQLHKAILNTAGEDHVKQMAARIAKGANFPVIIERTMTGDDRGDYHYPTGPDPELDIRRRALVVAALERFGIADANDRVLITTPMAEGITGVEAEANYQRAIYYSRATGSFGQGFGGFGGVSGFGGGVF